MCVATHIFMFVRLKKQVQANVTVGMNKKLCLLMKTLNGIILRSANYDLRRKTIG